MATNLQPYVKIHPLFYAAAIVITIAGLKIGAPIINPILMAIFFSIIIYHPIYWLKKKGVNGMLSILIVVVCLLAIVIFLGGAVTQSIVQFTHNMPLYKKELHEITKSSITLLNSYGLNISHDTVIENFNAGNAFSYVTQFITGVGGVLAQITLLILVAAFIIGEMNDFPIKLKAILKNPDISLKSITKISKNIRYYLGMKTLTGLFAATCVSIVLFIMHIEYAIIWGILVLLMRYIPNIGSIIAAIPILLFVLIQEGLHGVIYVGVAYSVINFIVGQIIEPKFFSREMNLSTLVVFLSLVFWGWILGDIGMLLAVPITMAAKISLGTHENSQWMAILLGSRKNAIEALLQKKTKEKQTD
ncbi:MAG: AI-2E family transporter [Bacteroidales bacterium]|nr:AI-2E family transporter [Bacteroidales bacterium]